MARTSFTFQSKKKYALYPFNLIGDDSGEQEFKLQNKFPTFTVEDAPITKGITTTPATQTYAGAVGDPYRKQEKSPTFVQQGEKVVAFPDDVGGVPSRWHNIPKTFKIFQIRYVTQFLLNFVPLFFI